MDSDISDPVIIEIEDDEICKVSVIDLDSLPLEKDEETCAWDATIRKRFSKFSLDKNILSDLMKEYLQRALEMAKTADYNELFRHKVFCHIGFMFSYYMDIQCCIAVDYLELMEDLLTFYCNLELDVVSTLQRNDSSLKSSVTLTKSAYKKRIVSVCKRMIHVLRVYLLNRDDHILHVLMKLNGNKNSKAGVEVLNAIYSHFLTKVPATDLSDESFCRSYILFQKWKDIRKSEDWKKMDEIMYKMFKRKPESIKTNETLKCILMPPCQSTADVVLQVFNASQNISAAYFKYISDKRNAEIEDIDFNIDLGEDDTILSLMKETEDEDDEFLKAYSEVEKNMSTLLPQGDAETFITDIVCKEENDQCDEIICLGTSQNSENVMKPDVPNLIVNGTSKGEEPKTQDPIQVTPMECSVAFEVPNPPDPETVPAEDTSNAQFQVSTETAENSAQPEVASFQEISVIPYSSEMEIESCVNVDVTTLETPPASCSLEFEVDSNKTYIISTLMEIGDSVSPDDDNIDIENCIGDEVPCSGSVSKSTQAEIPYDPEMALEVSRSPTSNKAFERVESPRKTSEFQLSLSGKKTRTVEVQANLDSLDKSDYYNCGFATPPSDVPTDDPSRTTETCVYPNIVRNDEIRISVDEDSRTLINNYQNSDECVNGYEYDTITNGLLTNSDILPTAKRKFSDSEHGLPRVNDMYDFLNHDTVINDVRTDIYNPSHPLEIEAVINRIGAKLLRGNDRNVNGDRNALGTTQHLNDLGQVNTLGSIPTGIEVKNNLSRKSLGTSQHLNDLGQVNTLSSVPTGIEVKNNLTRKILGTSQHLNNLRQVNTLGSIPTGIEVKNTLPRKSHGTSQHLNDLGQVDTLGSIPTGIEVKNKLPRRSLGTTQHLNDLGQVKTLGSIPTGIEATNNLPYRPVEDKEKDLHGKIDTGQKLIVPRTNDRLASCQSQEISRIVEPHNGNSVRKCIWDSRMAKEGREINQTGQILFTSSQKINNIPLDAFNNFEAQHRDMMNTDSEFADIFSGPITTNHKNVVNLNSQNVDHFGTSKQGGSLLVDANSGSNSPTESSPPYESMNDFGNYYSGAINGTAVRQPQSILRKPDSTRNSKKTNQISFHESTVDNTGRTRRKRRGPVSGEKGLKSNNHQNVYYDSMLEAQKRTRKDRSSVLNFPNGRNNYHLLEKGSLPDRGSRNDCGTVLSQYAYDPKILQTCRVQVEPLPINFNQKKDVLPESKTIRVDYPKGPTVIANNNVMHCVPPRNASWIRPPNAHDRHNTGSLAGRNLEFWEKKPKKAKYEPPNVITEPVVKKKRVICRTPKKAAVDVQKSRKKRQVNSTSPHKFISKSEMDQLIKSGAYSDKPFRPDLSQ